jgi:hypothetical protein
MCSMTVRSGRTINSQSLRLRVQIQLPMAIGGRKEIKPSVKECYLRGKLSTVDLLIKVTCFVTNEINIFNIKRNTSKLVFSRRSIVLSLPLQ